MPLQLLVLTPAHLLREVMKIIRPQRPVLPNRVLKELQNLNSLDLFLKTQHLSPTNVIAVADLSETARALSRQVLYGVRDNSQDTAVALRLWAGLARMRTRSARFAAIKLLVCVVDVLVDTVCDPTLCTTPLSTVTEVIEQLWLRFLSQAHRDVNSHQRATIVKHLASWAIKCPSLFWTVENVKIIARCLEDKQDNVRNESMRQVRRIFYELEAELLGTGPLRFWRRTLLAYAEHDATGTSVMRRIALELLPLLGSPTRQWCLRVLENCVSVKEPPATISCALRLVWSTQSENLTEAVLALHVRDEAAAETLGNALHNFRPNHAWDELSHAVNTTNLQDPDLVFVLHILVRIAKTAFTPKVMHLVEEILANLPSQFAFAARLMQHVKARTQPYFDYIDKLVDLRVDEVGEVIEQWTASDLEDGGSLVISKPRTNIPASLAGLVCGETEYKLAAEARNVVKLADTDRFQPAFVQFAYSLSTASPEIEVCEIAVVLRCLVCLYATAVHYGLEDVVQVEVPGFYRAISAFESPYTDSQEDILESMAILEKLGALQTIERPITDRFASSRAAHTVFVAGGVAI